MLETGIKKNQGKVNSLNASGKEIVRHSAAIDASVLQEKIEVLNERWKVVCSTVVDRHDRFVAYKYVKLSFCVSIIWS